MVKLSRKSSRIRLARGAILSLDQLDELLDVEVAAFDRRIAKLVRDFRSKAITLDIPEGEVLIALRPIDSSVSWTRLYEAQVKRLASMERAEEFRMARRYALVRARVVSALKELDLDEDGMSRILLRGSLYDLQLPKQPNAEQAANLDRAFCDFERLRNRYVEGALYMVLSSANRYRNLGVDFADLIQEGNASLFQAIEGFDWRRDVRFKTYAQYWIHQAVLKVLYNTSRTVRLPVWVQKALTKIHRVRERERHNDGTPPTAKQIGERLDMTEERVRELLGAKRGSVSLDADVIGEDGASLGQLIADDRIVPVSEAVQDGDLGTCLDEVMDELPSREHMIITRRFGLHGHEPETLGEIASDLGITAERVRQLQNAALDRLKRPKAINRLAAYT